MFTLTLIMALFGAPHLEQRAFLKASARGGKTYADRCALLTAAPFVTQKTYRRGVSRFLKRSKRAALYLPGLSSTAPKDLLLKSARVEPLSQVKISSGTTAFTLKNVWRLDLLSLFTERDFPITITVSPQRPGTLHLAFEGTASWAGGRSHTFSHNQVAQLSLGGPLKITLSAMTRGPLYLYMAPSKRSGPAKASSPTMKLRLNKPFYGAPSPCHLFAANKTLAKATRLAQKGTNPAPLFKSTKQKWPYARALIMGYFHLKRTHYRAAEREFATAMKAKPRALAPHLGSLEVLSSLGLHHTLLSRLSALKKTFPDTKGTLELRYRAYQALGRPTLEILRQRLKKSPSDGDLRNMVALELIHRGDAHKGLTLLRRGFDHGNLQSAALLGTYGANLSLARNLLRTLPSSLAGRLLKRARLVRKKDPSTAQFQAIVARHRKATPKSSGKKDNRIRSDVKVLYKDKLGTMRLYRQLFVEIGDPKKIGADRSFSTRFSPSNQLFQLLASKIHRADGSVSAESAVVKYRALNDVKARIYYDYRSVNISFPSFRPGDIIEIAYTIKTLPSGRTAPFMGTILQAQEFIPTDKVVMAFYSHPEKPLRVGLSQAGWAQKSRGVWSGLSYTLYKGTALPGAILEKGMPGWGESIKSVQVGQASSWAEVGRRYRDFIAPQYKLTPEIKSLAQKITRGHTKRTEKIRAIHAYVLKHFRYVSLMFGLHSYLPYETQEILSRRFGDCKDMTLLMVLLFQSVGIEALPTAIRTRALGFLPPKVPSLAHFDHSIVYLPKEKRWLDTTTKELLYPHFPPHLQGQPALIITKKGGRLTITPRTHHRANRELAKTTLTLSPSGRAQFTEELEARGAAEIGWRRLLEEGKGPTKWDHRYRSIKRRLFTITNLKNRLSPLKVRATMTLTNFVSRRRRTLRFRLGFYEASSLSGMIPYRNRRQDLLVAFPGEYTRKIALTLPRRFCLKERPRDLTLTTPWIAFSQTIKRGKRRKGDRRQGHTWRIHRKISLLSWRIKARDYNAFRAAVQKIRQVVDHRLTVAPCAK